MAEVVEKPESSSENKEEDEVANDGQNLLTDVPTEIRINRYSKELMLRLASSKLSNIRPACLSVDFNNDDGLWLPEKWLEDCWERTGVQSRNAPTIHQKHPYAADRLRSIGGGAGGGDHHRATQQHIQQVQFLQQQPHGSSSRMTGDPAGLIPQRKGFSTGCRPASPPAAAVQRSGDRYHAASSSRRGAHVYMGNRLRGNDIYNASESIYGENQQNKFDRKVYFRRGEYSSSHSNNSFQPSFTNRQNKQTFRQGGDFRQTRANFTSNERMPEWMDDGTTMETMELTGFEEDEHKRGDTNKGLNTRINRKEEDHHSDKSSQKEKKLQKYDEKKLTEVTVELPSSDFEFAAMIGALEDADTVQSEDIKKRPPGATVQDTVEEKMEGSRFSRFFSPAAQKQPKVAVQSGGANLKSKEKVSIDSSIPMMQKLFPGTISDNVYAGLDAVVKPLVYTQHPIKAMTVEELERRQLLEQTASKTAPAKTPSESNSTQTHNNDSNRRPQSGSGQSERILPFSVAPVTTTTSGIPDKSGGDSGGEIETVNPIFEKPGAEIFVNPNEKEKEQNAPVFVVAGRQKKPYYAPGQYFDRTVDGMRKGQNDDQQLLVDTIDSIMAGGGLINSTGRAFDNPVTRVQLANDQIAKGNPLNDPLQQNQLMNKLCNLHRRQGSEPDVSANKRSTPSPSHQVYQDNPAAPSGFLPSRLEQQLLLSAESQRQQQIINNATNYPAPVPAGFLCGAGGAPQTRGNPFLTGANPNNSLLPTIINANRMGGPNAGSMGGLNPQYPTPVMRSPQPVNSGGGVGFASAVQFQQQNRGLFPTANLRGNLNLPPPSAVLPPNMPVDSLQNPALHVMLMQMMQQQQQHRAAMQGLITGPPPIKHRSPPPPPGFCQPNLARVTASTCAPASTASTTIVGGGAPHIGQVLKTSTPAGLHHQMMPTSVLLKQIAATANVSSSSSVSGLCPGTMGSGAPDGHAQPVAQLGQGPPGFPGMAVGSRIVTTTSGSSGGTTAPLPTSGEFAKAGPSSSTPVQDDRLINQQINQQNAQQQQRLQFMDQQKQTEMLQLDQLQKQKQCYQYAMAALSAGLPIPGLSGGGAFDQQQQKQQQQQQWRQQQPNPNLVHSMNSQNTDQHYHRPTLNQQILQQQLALQTALLRGDTAIVQACNQQLKVLHQQLLLQQQPATETISRTTGVSGLASAGSTADNDVITTETVTSQSQSSSATSHLEAKKYRNPLEKLLQSVGGMDGQPNAVSWQNSNKIINNNNNAKTDKNSNDNYNVFRVFDDDEKSNIQQNRQNWNQVQQQKSANNNNSNKSSSSLHSLSIMNRLPASARAFRLEDIERAQMAEENRDESENW